MAIQNAAKESTTFWLVMVPFANLNIRYLLSSFDYYLIREDTMSPESFAIACSTVLSIWIAREVKEAWKPK